MVLPGVKVEQIRKVISHSQALAQCERYVRNKGWEPEPAYDTAGAVSVAPIRTL